MGALLRERCTIIINIPSQALETCEASHSAHLASLEFRTLQARNKWKKSHPNIKFGEVVIIKDETLQNKNIEINPWPLDLIIKVHPGPDELVRAVTVRCQDKTFTRPITRLVKLFTDENISPVLPPEYVQVS